MQHSASSSLINTPAAVEAAFRQLKAAHLMAAPASYALRMDRLQRLRRVITKNRQRIVDTLNADFEGHSPTQAVLSEVFVPVTAIDHARKHLKRWMRPQKRAPNFPFGLIGGRAEVQTQPLGVVGIIAPWNAPFALIFTPLVGVLAAGNRAIVKPSEYTPGVAALIRELFTEAFSAEEIAVVEGGAEVAQALVNLPLDHLLFTGGGKTARLVMRAAAANLVPVTLELGGKSPAILGDDADVAVAASKIMNGKLSNAGQICMCPDYAMLPVAAAERFVAAAKAATQRMYPDARNNIEYTKVFSGLSVERLCSMVREAEAAGAKVIPLVEGWTLDTLTDTSRSCRFPPLLVLDAPPDCRLMTTEVFGPVLPVLRYQALDSVIADLRKGEPPLALYYFGKRKSDIAKVLEQTVSGGVTINDIMMHPLMQNLPFGGVGESGMGRYVGEDGYKTFSHQKSVYKAGWLDITGKLQPPYGKLFEYMFKALDK